MPARAGPAVVSGSLPKCSSSLSAWRATRDSWLSQTWEVQPCSWAPLQHPAHFATGVVGRQWPPGVGHGSGPAGGTTLGGGLSSTYGGWLGAVFLATAMLCPAATGDTCTSGGTLPPEHAGTSRGQPGLVYHVQDDIVVQTLSHERCPTTGAWICPVGALELHWQAVLHSVLLCVSSAGLGAARTARPGEQLASLVPYLGRRLGGSIAP